MNLWFMNTNMNLCADHRAVLGLLFLGRGPDPQVRAKDKVICGYAGHHGIEKKVG